VRAFVAAVAVPAGRRACAPTEADTNQLTATAIATGPMNVLTRVRM
jgi:hypothetical protein